MTGFSVEDYNKEFTFDLPIVLHGLTLNPVTMIDYIDYSACTHILQMDKNAVDPRYIPMTYLDFLVNIMLQQDTFGMAAQLYVFKIFSLVLKKPLLKFKPDIDENTGKYILLFDDVQINAKQFDEIKAVILAQNNSDSKTITYMDADLRRDLEEVDRLRMKGKKAVSLEKQLILVMLAANMSLEQVYEMPIRKFLLAIQLATTKENYIMQKSASLSGMVTFKEEPLHYLYEAEDEETRVVDAEGFVKKINSTMF